MSYAVLLAGCERVFALDPPVDASTCYGSGLVQLCVDSSSIDKDFVVRDDLVRIDTGSSPTCDPYRVTGGIDPEACVIAAETITIEAGATLRATGARPLVLLASNALSVEGLIDISSDRTTSGAGADPMNCATGSSTIAGAKGGGRGGSLGGPGGNGGGANGGMANTVPLVLDRVRGGCKGGLGGTSGGAPGIGGGAVYAIAGSIEIEGIINASGGGGRGSPTAMGGGGGGGSGGMIGLESATITITDAAGVFANGGGGGEGAGGTGTGRDGGDPSEPAQPATGGMGGAVNGGDGGRGAYAEQLDGARGEDSADVGGGGGGGGGAGVLRLVSPSPVIAGIVSPPPT